MQRNVCEMWFLCFSTSFFLRLISGTEMDFSSSFFFLDVLHLGYDKDVNEVSCCHSILLKDKGFFVVVCFNHHAQWCP